MTHAREWFLNSMYCTGTVGSFFSFVSFQQFVPLESVSAKSEERRGINFYAWRDKHNNKNKTATQTLEVKHLSLNW
jgi:hypothetical protein